MMTKSLRVYQISGVWLAILFVVLNLFAEPAVARDKIDFPPLSEEWQKAIEPIRSMPVQDYGFIRSGYTFSENHLMAIANHRKMGKVDPVEAILRLLVDDEFRNTTPLIKVTHPELAKTLGGSLITLQSYRTQENHSKILNLIRTDQEKWLNPVNEVEGRAQTLEHLEEDFAILPREDVWISPGEAQGKSDLSDRDRVILQEWNRLKAAFNANDPSAAAEAATALSKAVEAAAAAESITLPKLSLDVFYHDHSPFSKSAVWYVFATLAYGASFLLGRKKIAWIGYGFLTLGFIEQCVGVAARWILSGRAPLSNMFESFTFAIGGMVLVALIFEAFNRTRLAGLGSAVLGFIFMVLAHKAPIFDSQIRPLMPALQSSWLTYHVVTIMLSYSAFALSFFVSIMYLVKDFFFRGKLGESALNRRLPSLDALDIFNYRIIGVGFPLLTLGIVFGAVWAATAWGRPWGFDPKETWSAITWLIYAIYLHIRFLAGWKGRRAAIFAIVGFLSVLFTYLGVNYLLAGLHSYA